MVRAWFDVEYTDEATDKARQQAQRSGGEVPPRKLLLDFQSSSYLPRHPSFHSIGERRIETSAFTSLAAFHLNLSFQLLM